MSGSDRPSDAILLLQRALTFVKERKDREAFILLCRAVTLEPALLAAHAHIGNIHYRHKNFSRAEVSFRHASELAPDNAEQQFFLGRTIANQGRDNEAVLSFENAARLKPQWGLAQFRLGACQFALGQFATAAQSLAKAAVLEPGMADAHMLRGRLFVRSDQMELAAWPLELAVAVSPALSRKKDVLMGTLTKDQLRQMLAAVSSDRQ